MSSTQIAVYLTYLIYIIKFSDVPIINNPSCIMFINCAIVKLFQCIYDVNIKFIFYA